MFKQMFIFLFGIILLTTFTQSASYMKINEDELDFESEELPEARSIQQNKLRNLDSDEELLHARRELFNLISLLARATDFTSDQRRFQTQMLNAHNNYRRCHSAPALTLDDNLSSSAQSWADNLARTGSFAHSPQSERPNIGENLYWGGASYDLRGIDGKVPTDDWYKEIKFYNFNQPGYSGATGHFTQLVWRGSLRLGVGIAFANNGRSVFVVARYSPQGNIIGQFPQNVFPPTC